MNKFRFIILILCSFLFSCCGTGSNPKMYDVNIAITPSEGGTVSPAADSSYETGDQITLIAHPAEYYKFSRWTGDIDTSGNPLSITVEQNMIIQAQFAKKKYPLTIHIKGEGAVDEQIVETESNRINDYEHGTVVQLTAHPAAGWKFARWTGALSDSTNPKQITIDEPKEVTAVFEPDLEDDNGIYFINIDMDGKGKIKLTLLDGEMRNGGYLYDARVQIKAIADTGWQFDHWEGDLESYGHNNIVPINIRENISATAVMDKKPFAGGTGEFEDPYQVATLEQLQLMRKYSGFSFILTADIDASPTKSWNDGKGFKPMRRFGGYIDGQGYIISNLTINRDTTEVGFIGLADNILSIKNIKFQDVDITGRNATGTIIGRAVFGIELNNITVTGKIKGQNSTGGIVGFIENDSVIKNSRTDVNISGQKYVGGIAGYFRSTTIEASSAHGTVTGKRGVGGLTGNFHYSNMSRSFSDATVSGSLNVGGIIGEIGNNHNYNDIINSYAGGRVEGERNVGGIAGKSEQGTLLQSFSYATIKGDTASGGVLGAYTGNC